MEFHFCICTTGVLVINRIDSNRTTQILTCISSGRPVDMFTWLKDGSPVGTEFTQNQTITDALTATYQHILTSDDIANFVGSFTCIVRGRDGVSASRTQILNGTATTVTLIIL